jgi:hypothetical protein
VNVINSTRVQCVMEAAHVGLHLVSLSLNGQRSVGTAAVHRLCPEGKYAVAGSNCDGCPKVRKVPGSSLFVSACSRVLCLCEGVH